MSDSVAEIGVSGDPKQALELFSTSSTTPCFLPDYISNAAKGKGSVWKQACAQWEKFSPLNPTDNILSSEKVIFFLFHSRAEHLGLFVAMLALSRNHQRVEHASLSKNMVSNGYSATELSINCLRCYRLTEGIPVN
ncbi:unnamed protein product [Ceratitis capitata]|uniref:(Mediterranean fruit fly) hypothetical protein n=1 Tax=Ceratitis capitata TaxID=7213 RepID=A0A811U4N3_CERCA|nr:unnamed protein product [Ceratitis capitata]